MADNPTISDISYSELLQDTGKIGRATILNKLGALNSDIVAKHDSNAFEIKFNEVDS